MLVFEWDPKKSKLNKKKHGISFVEATEIWKSTHITVLDIARSQEGENHSATVGIVAGAIYTAIWTQRDHAIRLISVRRARTYEKEAFKKKII